jgi:flagellar basal-body rod protein FlgF
MEAGLVSAVSGALAQSRRVEIAANNLANADTVGFKADGATFEEYVQGAQRDDYREGGSLEVDSEIGTLPESRREKSVVLYGEEFAYLKSGALTSTNNPFDLAIEGNGFFEVQTPEGIRLTRAGNLSLDRQGRLVTRDGFLVLGDGNPNAAPEQRAIQVGTQRPIVDKDGAIYVMQEGQMLPIGRVGIVQVGNPRDLKKEGNGFFSAGEAADLRRAGEPARGPAGVEMANNPLGAINVPAQIHQGFLEASNVNPILEMTQMIEAHRLFDQNAKLMQSFGTLNQQSSELGKF